MAVAEGDRSGPPDRAPGRAHLLHGDRHVERALAQIDRGNGEIRRRAGGARQIDDGAVIGLAILRPERRGTADFEAIVDPFVHIRAHDRMRAIEHAHEVLALVDELARADQHLPDPALRRQSNRRFRTERDARIFLRDLRVDVGDLCAHARRAERRARPSSS